MPQPRPRTFAVIGLGTFGSTIAVELERLGKQVLGVDRSEQRVGAVADRLSHAVIADARDERALADAGLADCDVAVVAIGEDLESSILCTMALKTMGVKTVWVKALSQTHARILVKLGADRVIEPEREIGLQVAQSLNTPYVLDYIRMAGDFFVVKVAVDDTLDGRNVGDLGLGGGSDVRFLGVMRGVTFLPGDDELVLKGGDRMLLMGRQEELRRLGKSL
ncbi:potassium channel family protein [Azospirillum sp. ST 5-10]|uniref:potassium channel family protein n=1 Tax=unclassified Azospirillum TaxID=2630922 RepID=UPI003F49C978